MKKYKNCIVSEDGKFYSIFTGKERKLQKIARYLYLNTGTGKDGKEKIERAHRIIAMLYVPNPLNKPHVNHKDGNKYNNHANNLEWCTLQENHLHAYKSGIRKAKTGEQCSYAKFTKDQVLLIRKLYSTGTTVTDLSKKFKRPLSTISAIIHKRSWKHI